MGDSRISNLRNYADLNVEKWLIRTPMLSEVESTVKYADVSLNSEQKTITALNEAAASQNKTHKIILMIELGDLREGIYDKTELFSLVRSICEMPNIELYGIGANLTCLSFIQPTIENLNELERYKNQIEEKTNIKLAVLSGGNSASINLLISGKIPKTINNLRLGESILFGKERSTYTYLNHFYNDAFLLKSEIIELKEKPSMPWGNFGCDSCGEYRQFTDKGVRRRGICAVGKQDIDIETVEVLDRDLSIIGYSSDHLVLDFTNSRKNYHLGDTVELKLGYYSTLRAFTSSDIEREYRY